MTDPLPFLAAPNRAIASAWAKGRWEPPTLDPDRLESYAAAREGLDRVPGQQWREPFRRLLADLQDEAHLSPLGRVMANGQLIKLLRARCRAERLLRRHPEIAEQPIERPVVIMGPMRSGTTRLQRLLACDASFVTTRLYETLDPVPYGRGIDRRPPVSVALLAFLRRANPALHAIHPTSPRAAEEEFGHLSFAMHGAQFEAQWRLPQFARYAEERDTAPVYNELRHLLQLNGWARKAASRTWLLKCPQYTADPDSLLEAFPDARLIFLHRDPVDVVGSSASLVLQQRRLHSDSIDPHEIGRDWLRKTALRERRNTAFRAANPKFPQLDLDYDEVSRDWRGAMNRVYDFLGLTLKARTIGAMSGYLRSARAHHGHRYSLAEFGLSQADVLAAFDPPVFPGAGALGTPTLDCVANR